MGAKAERNAKETATRMRKLRFDKRSVLFSDRDLVLEMQGLLPGPMSRGKDSYGEGVITRKPEDLKIKIRGSKYVTILTKRERTELVDRKTPLFGKIPKKNVSSRTNRFIRAHGEGCRDTRFNILPSFWIA